MLASKLITLTISWWFAMTLALSAIAQESAQDDTATPVSAVPADNNLFASAVKAEEKAWLTVNGNRMLALYRSETSGKAHGGVLIIPKAGQHPTSPGIINALRHALSDHHWHTLALDMMPVSDENGTIDENQTMKLITAGIAYLNKQGIYNIAILGEGAGATLAMHYSATLSPSTQSTAKFQQIRALVMINAQNKIPGSNTDTLKTFAAITLPMLDAYSDSDFYFKQQATQRKMIAGKRPGHYHQQIRLPRIAVIPHQHENRVTKRVRGWLDKNIAGFMVQNNDSR